MFHLTVGDDGDEWVFAGLEGVASDWFDHISNKLAQGTYAKHVYIKKFGPYQRRYKFTSTLICIITLDQYLSERDFLSECIHRLKRISGLSEFKTCLIKNTLDDTLALSISKFSCSK